MIHHARSFLSALLKGVAWLSFVIAGLAFWWGGRAIHEFYGTERLLAEMEDIGAAVVIGALGIIAKAKAQDFEISSTNLE